ncbi:MAG: ribose 5-phosphate isomerase [Thermoplasmata archaeon]|jgi:ribose 5-phosphate isomerase A|nr:ribose 5-phosphate isomerase [Thermoplasmata archaeon]
MDKEAQKREAGEAAAALAQDGMVVGLGTGSTVRYTIEALGRKVAAGLRIVGIPTSIQSEQLARKVGIPLTTLDEHPVVDLTIDGADELDAQLRLIKGGGGALAREKVVARVSRRMVVVADAAKQVERLGSTFALPIEVLPFGARPVADYVASLGARVTLRTAPDGSPYRTDNGNAILDARWPAIDDPERLETQLETYPGVVTCGLFLGLCSEAFVAGPGGVRRVQAAPRSAPATAPGRGAGSGSGWAST